MATIGFGTHKDDGIELQNFTDTVIVRLWLPVGSFIIFGKTVMSNADTDPQDATVRLTTMDGATDLDRADVRLKDTAGEEVSLQAHLVLTNDTPDRIVDLRAQTYFGGVNQTKLYAIQIDALKMDD